MKVQCEICSEEVDVVSHTCCTGSVYNIECGCEGKDHYEGIALCNNCFDFLEMLEDKGMAIHVNPQDDEGHKFALTLDDCAEVC